MPSIPVVAPFNRLKSIWTIRVTVGAGTELDIHDPEILRRNVDPKYHDRIKLCNSFTVAAGPLSSVGHILVDGTTLALLQANPYTLTLTIDDQRRHDGGNADSPTHDGTMEIRRLAVLDAQVIIPSMPSVTAIDVNAIYHVTLCDQRQYGPGSVQTDLINQITYHKNTESTLKSFETTTDTLWASTALSTFNLTAAAALSWPSYAPYDIGGSQDPWWTLNNLLASYGYTLHFNQQPFITAVPANDGYVLHEASYAATTTNNLTNWNEAQQYIDDTHGADNTIQVPGFIYTQFINREFVASNTGTLTRYTPTDQWRATTPAESYVTSPPTGYTSTSEIVTVHIPFPSWYNTSTIATIKNEAGLRLSTYINTSRRKDVNTFNGCWKFETDHYFNGISYFDVGKGLHTRVFTGGGPFDIARALKCLHHPNEIDVSSLSGSPGPPDKPREHAPNPVIFHATHSSGTDVSSPGTSPTPAYYKTGKDQAVASGAITPNQFILASGALTRDAHLTGATIAPTNPMGLPLVDGMNYWVNYNETMEDDGQAFQLMGGSNSVQLFKTASDSTGEYFGTGNFEDANYGEFTTIWGTLVTDNVNLQVTVPIPKGHQVYITQGSYLLIAPACGWHKWVVLNPPVSDIWKFELSTDMTAGEAEATVGPVTGGTTFATTKIHDYLGIHDHLEAYDVGYCRPRPSDFDLGGTYHFVIVETELDGTGGTGDELYRFALTQNMGASTADQATANIYLLNGSAHVTSIVYDQESNYADYRTGDTGFCMLADGIYTIVEVTGPRLYRFTTLEGMGDTHLGQVNSTIKHPTGTARGTAFVHDPEALFFDLEVSKGGLCLFQQDVYYAIAIDQEGNGGEIYRWTATADWATNAIAATVTDMDGGNSGAQSVKDPHSLHPDIETGDKGICFKGGDGLYQLIEVESLDELFRFTLTGTLTSTGACTITEMDGTSVAGATSVENPHTLYTDRVSGDKGLCYKQNGSYYVVEMEDKTHLYRFKLGQDMGASIINQATGGVGIMTGGDPGKTGAILKDPVGIFDTLQEDDEGICYSQDDNYYILQATC